MAIRPGLHVILNANNRVIMDGETRSTVDVEVRGGPRVSYQGLPSDCASKETVVPFTCAWLDLTTKVVG